MGTFNVELRAVGNHGCGREVKSGETMQPCRQPNCTDCITREFLEKLKAAGASVTEARIIHWPDGGPQILDDILREKRAGSF